MTDFNVKVSYTTNSGTKIQEVRHNQDFDSIFNQCERVVETLLQQEKSEVIGISNLWYSKAHSRSTDLGAQSIFYGYKFNNQVYKTFLAREGANFCSKALKTLANEIGTLVGSVNGFISKNSNSSDLDSVFRELTRKVNSFARTKFVAGPVVKPLIPQQLMIVTYGSMSELTEIIPNVLKGQLLRHYGIVLFAQANNPGLRDYPGLVREPHQIASICGLYNGLQAEFQNERNTLVQDITQLKGRIKQLEAEVTALKQKNYTLDKNLEQAQKTSKDQHNDITQLLSDMQELLEMNKSMSHELQKSRSTIQRTAELEEFRDLQKMLRKVEAHLQQIEQEGNSR